MSSSKAASNFLINAATIYIAAGFALFLSVADNHYSKENVLPLAPTVSALIFMVSIVGFVLIRNHITHSGSIRLGFLIRSNLAVIVPWGILVFTSLLFALLPTAYWGQGKKWIYLQAYDFTIFLMAMLLPAIEFVRRRFNFFVTVGLIALLGSIFYEVQNPGTYSSVPTRASGFPGNSNWGALASVMICSMTLRYKGGASRMFDLIVLGATGLAVYFTFSRSGTVNLILLAMFYVGINIISGKDRLKTGLTLVLCIVALVTFFLLVVPMMSDSAELTEGSKASKRLLAIFEGEVVDDGSAADRMEAARETIDMIEASPIVGHGTGFNRTMRQTPHNLYLKLWVDAGIFGLIAWLALLICAAWLFSSRKYRPGQALILVTAFGSLFSHNILEQRTFLILFGCATSMSLYESAAHVKRVRALQALSQIGARETNEQDASKTGLSS